MTRSVVQIRVDEDELERWRAAAKEDLVTLSTFVRDAVEVRIAGARRDPMPEIEADHARRVRASCRNRQRHAKGVRCAYCGTTP